jgi:hypothetical protein
MRYRFPIIVTALTIVTMLGLGGCANMTTTEQRTLSGAGIGALGGAAIAAIAESSVATGALIGAGVGAGAGYLYSRSQTERHAAYHPTSTKRRHYAVPASKPSKPGNPPRTSDQTVAASSPVKLAVGTD